jgi:predicted AAA+ superfamily ATPase
MTQKFFRRLLIDEIIKYLHTDEIVVLHGARQVGKTTCLLYLQNHLQNNGYQTIYLDLEDSRFVKMIDQGIDEFLLYLSEQGHDLQGYKNSENKLYVLVDEIQYLQNPSSFMKQVADHHHHLKLIVSGSSSFEMKSKFKNALVGRTVNFEMYPLSFQEFLVFKEIPFKVADQYSEIKNSKLRSLFLEFALYGGYPKIVLTPDVSMKEKYLQQIIDTYIRKDIRDLAEIKEITKFNRLLEILASQSGNLLNANELSNTCALSLETVGRYLFLLEQTYIIRLVRPYSRNIRTELTKTPKIFFYDTGLMQMLWLKRLQKELLGSVFETAIFSELIKKYGVDQIHYWRTKDKKEIDFVVNLPDALLPIKVKTQFPRSISAEVDYFIENYSTETTGTNFKLIGLNGQPSAEGMVFPWQI